MNARGAWIPPGRHNAREEAQRRLAGDVEHYYEDLETPYVGGRAAARTCLLMMAVIGLAAERHFRLERIYLCPASPDAAAPWSSARPPPSVPVQKKTFPSWQAYSNSW